MGIYIFIKTKLELYDKVTMAVLIRQFHQISVEKKNYRKKYNINTY